MAYEWDARKARRTFMMKFAAAWGTAIIIASLPVMVAVKAMPF